MALLHANLSRARELAPKLYTAFSISGEGIFGRTVMPEDEPPQGVERGSLEHLLFITLTVTIDYLRDAHELWDISRAAYADSNTRYLFNPSSVYEAGLSKVRDDMMQVGLTWKPNKDPKLWHTVAVTFLKKWDSNPRNFLADCDYHAPKVLQRLKTDSHLQGSRLVKDYPYLRGPKISCLWIRMLRDNVRISLSGLVDVPIPVDVHVLRATLCTGVLRGYYNGPVDPVFVEVRAVWKEAVKGLQVPNSDQDMIALDVDEPLWHLSKFGCRTRGNDVLGGCPPGCPASPGCVSGRIRIRKTHCEVDT